MYGKQLFLGLSLAPHLLGTDWASRASELTPGQRDVFGDGRCARDFVFTAEQAPNEGVRRV